MLSIVSGPGGPSSSARLIFSELARLLSDRALFVQVEADPPSELAHICAIRSAPAWLFARTGGGELAAVLDAAGQDPCGAPSGQQRRMPCYRVPESPTLRAALEPMPPWSLLAEGAVPKHSVRARITEHLSS